MCVGELRVSFFRCKSVKINLLKNAITHLCIALLIDGENYRNLLQSRSMCGSVSIKSYCFNKEQASCSCRRDLPTESIDLRFLCFQ